MRPDAELTPMPAVTAFRELSRLAHTQLPDTLSPAEEARSLARLQERLAPRPWWVGVSRWSLATVATAALLATGTTVWRHSQRLSYYVQGGVQISTGYIQSQRTEGSTVHFSDGTEVSIDKDSRSRIAEVDAHGAHLALEDGRAHIHVAKLPKADWTFDAGPYAVQVTGTSFDLSWSARDQRLDLKLITGSVTVRGPFTGDSGVKMTAGQRLTASPLEKEVRIQPLSTEANPAPINPPESPPAVTVAPAVTSTPRPTLPPRINPAGNSWGRRLAAGDHLGIVREAERQGLAQTLSHASNADLAILADAARYVRRDDVARRSLGAQRARFPGTAHAQDASFLLGRLAEDRASDLHDALSWYERYLREAPDGSYAADALGRRMMVLRKFRGREQACEAAKEYLRKYQSGPYAQVARSLCPTP